MPNSLYSLSGARTSKIGTRLNFCIIIAPGTTSEEGKKASKGSVCFGLALTFLELLVPHGVRLMESASHAHAGTISMPSPCRTNEKEDTWGVAL